MLLKSLAKYMLCLIKLVNKLAENLISYEVRPQKLKANDLIENIG